MTSMKSVFPYFSGFLDGNVEHKDDESPDIASFIFTVEAVLDAKGIKGAITNRSPTAWNERTEEQKDVCKELYPKFLLALRGRAAKLAQAAPDKDLRGVYHKVVKGCKAQTRGKRMLLMKQWLSGGPKDGEDMETFIRGKKNTLDHQLDGKISPEELLKLAILDNLPKDFDTVRTPLMAVDGDFDGAAEKQILEREAQLDNRKKPGRLPHPQHRCSSKRLPKPKTRRSH